MDRQKLSRVVSAAWAAFPDRAEVLLRELTLSRSDTRVPLPDSTCLVCGDERMPSDLATPLGGRGPVQEPMCLGCLGLAARAADDAIVGARPTPDAVLADLTRALAAARADDLVRDVETLLLAPHVAACWVCGIRPTAPPVVRGLRPICLECVERYRRSRSCPCCGYATLTERDAFAICPVCFWEDDGQEDEDAGDVRGGPNGALSLSQARRNFVELAASDPRSLGNVRRPATGEPRLRRWAIDAKGALARAPLDSLAR